MNISIEEVARIAALARLELDEDKSREFAGQLTSILEYMETLNKLDTQSVEPMYSPVENVSRMRADEENNLFSRDDVLSNAPKSDGAFFIVPKIV